MRQERDRDHPPCKRCGVELYDKYFGNGGWMPTEVESGRHHHDGDCARRLAAEVATFRKALAESAAVLERGEAALLKACHERGQFHTERDQQRSRAVALEQQVLTLRARCIRLVPWAIIANAEEENGDSFMPLFAGDLATSYPELPEQGEGGGQ